MTKVKQIPNPFFMSDTFVFKEHKELGTVYIKVNYAGKIEEIGIGIHKRMHLSDDDVLPADEASRTNIRKLNSIGDEYWWSIHNRNKRLGW